jgi:cation:H+ antiporter
VLVARIAAVVVGLVLLARAADRFVLGAATIARRLGVSAVVVGAVIVGFGTSAPELLVSGLAAWEGHADLGVGNIIGSNIANLTLVLGIGATISPLMVSTGVLRREAPAAVLAMGALAVLVQGNLGRVEGIVLLVAFVVMMLGLLVLVRRETRSRLADETDEMLTRESDVDGDPATPTPLRTEVLWVVVGLVGTIAGAQLLVWGATGIADRAGLSDGFVGLTLVAVGTSLPELVTTAQAARRGEHDLIVGNLLGSNLVNSLAVGGVVGVLAPGAPLDGTLTGVGTGVMMGVGLVAVLFMRRKFRLTRGEGIALVAGYAATVPLLA